MDRIWEVDERNTVTVHFGAFGKKVVKVNGNEAYNSRKFTSTGQIAFAMPDGRGAAIAVKPQFPSAPRVDLRIDGNLMVETTKTPIKCAACGTAARSFDRFCGKCGKAMPTAEDYELQKNVKSATGAIKILAVLFVLGGLLFFFIAKNQSDAALAQLHGMDDRMTYPAQIEGRSYTVGELRKQIEWEPWGVLSVNLILAVIMVGLALWARRAPLPAVLVAAATYAVVIVGSAIMDPATLAQGWIVKLIIVAFLYRGIKAALALRTASA